MSIPDAPSLALDLLVEADHGQIYIYSAAAVDFEDEENEPYLDALDDAVDSERFVGTASGLIDLKTPGQWNFKTPMRLEIWTVEPPDDTEEWSHEVDVDLDVPDGRLLFEASGGGTPIPVDVPVGSYRTRVSGAGYQHRGAAGADGNDHYRLRLWPRTVDTAPKLRKSWPGWKN